MSWCTGLPAPEAADVPLKYKFSWSPASVLLNTINPAKCLLAGKVALLHATIIFSHMAMCYILVDYHCARGGRTDET